MAEQKPSSKPICAVRDDTSLEWGAVDNRRRSAPNERYAGYLGNKLRSDMVFHVRRDNFKIPAHRLIVGAASPVLEKIAYGSGELSGTIDDVPVTDCSADEFYEVLRFVYTHEVNLTTSNATTILLLAHFYDLQSLEKECATFLLRTLSSQNVCNTFGQIYMMDNALTKECLRLIQNHTDQLFVTTTDDDDDDDDTRPSLFDLGLEPLGQVFKLDSLRVCGEVELFAALLQWGRAECVAKDLPATATHLRHALDGRIDFIRFAAMTTGQFAECVKMVEPPFFSNDEISVTLQRIAQIEGYGAHPEGNTIRLSHHTTPRMCHYGGKELSVPAQRGTVRAITEDVFTVSCSKTILNGFESLLSTNSSSPQFSVTYCDSASQLQSPQQMSSVDFKVYGRRILFNKPMTFANATAKYFKIKYTASVTSEYEVNSSDVSSEGITFQKYDEQYSYNHYYRMLPNTVAKILYSDM